MCKNTTGGQEQQRDGEKGNKPLLLLTEIILYSEIR